MRLLRAPQGFKPCTSTIPPPWRIDVMLEARRGFAPLHSGFADRRVASSPPGRELDDTMLFLKSRLSAGGVSLPHQIQILFVVKDTGAYL